MSSEDKVEERTFLAVPNGDDGLMVSVGMLEFLTLFETKQWEEVVRKLHEKKAKEEGDEVARKGATLDVLLKTGMDFDRRKKRRVPLDDEMVEEDDPNVDRQGDEEVVTFHGTLLQHAVLHGAPLEVIRALVEAGADPRTLNRKKSNALHFAVYAACDVELVDYLLQQGGDGMLSEANTDGTTPWHFCFYLSEPERVEATLVPTMERLLQVESLDVNVTQSDEYNALHFAAQNGAPAAVVRRLIDAGVDAHALNADGWTPLMLSCRNPPQEGVVQIFLDVGSDLACRSAQAWTALMLACRYHASDREDDIRLMLDRSDTELVRAATQEEWTALHMISREGGSARVIDWLIQAGASLECTNRFGLTPLHLAVYASENKFRTVRLLLSRGANRRAVSHAGKTPLQLMQELLRSSDLPNREDAEAAAYLLKHWDSELVLLLLLGLQGPSNALSRFASHSMFDVNLLGIVLELLDGQSHAIDFGRRALRAKQEREG